MKVPLSNFKISILLVLIILSNLIPSFAKINKEKSLNNENLIDKSKQAQIQKETIFKFLKSNQNRNLGDGLFFLANHYYDLKQPQIAIDFLNKIVRNSTFNIRIRAEAQLLLIKILLEQKPKDPNELKAYLEKIIKEYNRLLSWSIPIDLFYKAKYEYAKVLGYGVSTFDDLIGSFYKLYSNFPDLPEPEELQYLVGFKKGYNLETAMKGLEVWEELATIKSTQFTEYKNAANLQIAIFYAYDLNRPKIALDYLSKINSNSNSIATSTYTINKHFVLASIYHIFSDLFNPNKALKNYEVFIKNTKDLFAYRVANLLLSDLLSSKLGRHEEAINILEQLASPPLHLISFDTISLQRKLETEQENLRWSKLCYKIAGYIAEYRLKKFDLARILYQKASDFSEKLTNNLPDFWLKDALKRLEPSISQEELEFRQAYEKYRARDIVTALKLYEEFAKKYPNHFLAKEALYRAAIILDDDLKKYDEALEKYQNYIITVVPVKSSWKLDVIYDFNRLDEVRYRIAILYAYHLNEPLKALKYFDDISTVYPDSYWAIQAQKEAIKITKEVLEDLKSYNDRIDKFIKTYPTTKEAQQYRLSLYKNLLSNGNYIEAQKVLKDYVYYSSPEQPDYLETIKNINDLNIQIQANYIKNSLANASSTNDICLLYESLIDTLSLASTSAPLVSLASEVLELKIPDQNKWLLTYQIAKSLYYSFPTQSKQILKTLAHTSTGTAKLLCLLSLGNIAYTIEKNRKDAILAYEQAISMAYQSNQLLETPYYRLARLYAVEGYFYKAIKSLSEFIKFFQESRYLPNAYKTLADIYRILKKPKTAYRYYKLAIKLKPELYEKNKSIIDNLEKQITALPELPTEFYIKEIANTTLNKYKILATSSTNLQIATDSNQLQSFDTDKKLTDSEISTYEPDKLYQIYLLENSKAKPDENYCVNLLKNIILKAKSSQLLEKAVKHYISWRFFKSINKTAFIDEAQDLLRAKNFIPETSELLFRVALVYELYSKDYQKAIKTYFEFISLFPTSSRIANIRLKIPQLYEKLGDSKNSLKFYSKIIEDPNLPSEIRAIAALSKAKIEEFEEKKEEAVKTLLQALDLKSTKDPEIYIRLEKLTDNFEYIYKALASEGSEEFRFEALKIIKSKLEKDKKFSEIASILEKYSDSFENPEYTAWIQKQKNSLGKIEQIQELEKLIETYPEEAQTPQRLFKLASLVEGNEYSKYKARDLFYEITLLYPASEFYKESKIRAENYRVSKNLQEIEILLNKGLSQTDSYKYMLVAAKLNYENLENIAKAKEYLEALLKLDPPPEIKAEALYNLANILYKHDKDYTRSINYLEQALLLSKMPSLRNEIIKNIILFKKAIQDSEKVTLEKAANLEIIVSSYDKANVTSKDIEKFLQNVFNVWLIDKDIDSALNLLKLLISKDNFKNFYALLNYYCARLYEEKNQYNNALIHYENAYKTSYHPLCRKDMVLYRMARLYTKLKDEQNAYNTYNLLVTKYPKSLLSRSAFYNLYKIDYKKGNLSLAHHRLSNLLLFNSLHPKHRKKLQNLLEDLSSKLFISEIRRISNNYSSKNQSSFNYFAAKVFEKGVKNIDMAIKNYEDYLKNPLPISKARETTLKIVDLYEAKGDYIKAVYYLDQLLQSIGPKASNKDIILRINNLIEDRINNIHLLELFWQSIYFDYKKIPAIRNLAKNKLKQVQKLTLAKAVPTAKTKQKTTKRVYTDKDKEIIENLEEIKKKYVDDLQDYNKAEEEMLNLWEENKDSFASYEIMRELVDLCENKLLDPQKAAEYMKKWIDENPDDPDITLVTLKLYDLYFEKLKDGDRALNLLKEFISKYPNASDRNSILLKIGLVNEQILKSYDEARRTYQLIIDMRRNDPIIHEAYYRMGFVLRDGYADYNNAIRTWEELNNLYYQNNFAADSLFAIAETYEIYLKDYTNARIYYEKILNQYPNTQIQNKVRDALLRIRGK